MVHMSDIAWGISGEDALALHRKGEQVKAVVLDVDVEKERISLGMKQLEKGAPTAEGAAAGGAPARSGDVVTVTVLEVRDGGLEVQAGDDGATGFIKRTRPRPRPRRTASRPLPGRPEDRRDGHRLRPFEEAELLDQGAPDRRREGSRRSSSVRPTRGASLGDILGEALKKQGRLSPSLLRTAYGKPSERPARSPEQAGLSYAVRTDA